MIDTCAANKNLKCVVQATSTTKLMEKYLIKYVIQIQAASIIEFTY